MASRKYVIKKVLAAALLIFGFFMVFYPFLADVYNDWIQSKALDKYSVATSEMTTDEQNRLYDEAVAYNKELSGNVQEQDDPFIPGSDISTPDNYMEFLNINGDGIMGVLRIPSINVKYPIYHTTDEDVLKYGIGHLSQTMLPVGGETSNCVLTGHRGLPNAELFTNLDKLVIGDEIYIDVLGRTIGYRVYDSKVVTPEELSENLEVEPGHDIITLVTCTPYAVNTHRLVVYAERFDYQPGHEQVGHFDVTKLDPRSYAAGIGVAFLIFMIVSYIRKKKRKKDEAKKVTGVANSDKENN